MANIRRLCIFTFTAGALVFGAARFPWADAPDTRSSPPQPLSEDEYYELFEVFADALDQIERNYVQKVSREELLEAAIEGMLSKLDVHSDYISPDKIADFRTSVENQFAGIGVQITPDLTISTPLYGTPGYRAGLRAGDKIVKIEGESTEEWDISDAVGRLKGEPGTAVNVSILRPGEEEEIEFSITREIINLETVLGYRRTSDDKWHYLFDDESGIAYIRISTFGQNTPDELETVLTELVRRSMKGLVLDLRFNPGGFLSSAIEVCDLFVSGGVIVSTEGRNVEGHVWKAAKKGSYVGFPMAVLVNGSSASASEIVAACLQDHDRAVVIGERTWGKGSVQHVVELPGGKSALKITTSSYKRPSGKNIDRPSDAKEDDEWGVRPNEGYEVPLRQREIFALYSDLHKRGIIGNHVAENGGSNGEGTGTASVNDRQLDRALKYIREELD